MTETIGINICFWVFGLCIYSGRKFENQQENWNSTFHILTFIVNIPGHKGENLVSSSFENRELYHNEIKADILKHSVGKRKWGKKSVLADYMLSNG